VRAGLASVTAALRGFLRGFVGLPAATGEQAAAELCAHAEHRDRCC
jgi:hypothetical protein